MRRIEERYCIGRVEVCKEGDLAPYDGGTSEYKSQAAVSPLYLHRPDLVQKPTDSGILRPLGQEFDKQISRMQRFSRKSRKFGLSRMLAAFLLLGVLWLALSAARMNKMPQNLADICSIFEVRRDWYSAAKQSEERWGTPKHVQMSIIRQESSFQFNARPPRTLLLGFIPWKRSSDAYGYAQALDSTWIWYQNDTGRQFANRDDFDDAIDFVGWYTNMTNKSAGISKWDPYNQYLAYHEGPSGWRRGTYKQKDWLKESAQRVDHRAREWWAQLQRCEGDLDDGWWVFWG